MRLIGSISNQPQADRFGDYLVTLDIDHSLEQNDGDRWDVWITDDDEVERGKRELEQFLRSPDDPRYNVGTKAKAIRIGEEKKQKKLRKNFIDVRTRWSFGQGSYWVTLVLIVISGIVAAVTWLGSQLDPIGYWLLFSDVRMDGDSITWSGWEPILHGQVWRLFTPMFIHFGVLHFIFNMFWLRDLGAMIENRRGPWGLLGLALMSSLVGNVLQYWWTDSFPLFGGMSGVVYGLFGYAWMKSRYEPHLNIHVGQQTVFIMLIWLAITGVGIVGGIATAAHVGGLLVGLAAGYLPIGWRRFRRRR